MGVVVEVRPLKRRLQRPAAAPGLRGLRLLVVLGLHVAPTQASADSAPLSEADFFAPMAPVLSVTRLAQPLADVPGAVTVLDRDIIRRSGARDLAELLRLVPGYMVGGFNGANMSAAYHMPLDEYGQRNLVLVDGRSLYGSGYLGGTVRGLPTVVLDDIERIEVLRGSNSAAYGANALFGVINVVTRHAADVERRRLVVNVGNDGILDLTAGVAWVVPGVHHRLTVQRMGDDGYLPGTGVNDARRVAQLHWRADAVPDAGLEWSWRAGVSDLALGMGYEGNVGDAPRTLHQRWLYAQWQARHELAGQDALRWSLAWDRIDVTDRYAYAPLPPVVVDFGGREQRVALDVQHERRWSDAWRSVLGLGWSREGIRSRPLFDTDAEAAVQRGRAFATLEWRATPRWVVNAGLYATDHSRLGLSAWPRLMVNHHLNEHHTLRAGVTRAGREPLLFEQAANVRYRFPTPPYEIATVVSSGTVGLERLDVRELGYLGHWPQHGLSVDVRLAREQLRDYIEEVRLEGQRRDFVNRGGFVQHSLEYQLRWQPNADTRWWLGQVWTNTNWVDARYLRQPPKRMLTAGWWQALPNGWDVAVMVFGQSRMSWRQPGTSSLPGRGRVDVRLAHRWRSADTDTELALGVQSLGGAQSAFIPSRVLDRRVYLTLRLTQ